ncbi:MAG: amidohydrolase family protein, partial [Armatimonadetes bacterium]|nr:amidohydrolase family protein [Armatimonadota bacterium]
MTDRIAILGGQLIDGTGRDPIPRAGVIIEGERITAAGPLDSLSVPPGAARVDAEGMTLMPGLIDAHVHITQTGEADLLGMVTRRTFPDVVIDATGHLASTLDAGVTAIRTVGDIGHIDIAARNAVTRGKIRGPRVVAAGRALTSTGGHACIIPHWVQVSYGDISEIVDSPDAARAAVRRQVQAGCDHIKIFQTGGVIDPGGRIEAEEFSDEELRVICATARATMRFVTCHAHNKGGILRAVAAGVRSIEHGMYFDEECAARAVEAGVFLVPTLIVMENILRRGPEAGLPPFMMENVAARTRQHHACVLQAFRAGVKIVTGTDAGSVLTPHGSAGAEVAMLVRAGLPPLEAIKAATQNAAELLKIADQTGTLG